MPSHSTHPNGRRGKVGFQWAVYHQHGGHNVDGVLASGITDKPHRARLIVEMILAEVDGAAWGLLVRVVLDVNSTYRAEDPIGDWPPAGEVQYCRRATDGGFNWGPLNPRDNVLR